VALNDQQKKDAKYSYAISPRLGATNSKEQYAFLYHSSIVKLIQTVQYPDPKSEFSRPPYGAVFEITFSKVKKQRIPFRFFLMGMHVVPSDAKNEISAFLKVYTDYYATQGMNISADNLDAVKVCWLFLFFVLYKIFKTEKCDPFWRS